MGWNRVVNSREARQVTTMHPSLRGGVLRNLSGSFAAVMSSAAKWEAEARAWDASHGSSGDEKDALRDIAPVLTAMIGDLVRIYGVRRDFSETEPPCWSPRYESYIHSAMPMYRVTEVISFKGQSVPMGPEVVDETDIVARLTGRPFIGYAFDMDDVDEVLDRVQKRGKAEVFNAQRNSIMSLEKQPPRAATDLEMFSGLVYLTAREYLDAKPGQMITPLSIRIHPMLDGDPERAAAIEQENTVLQFEREQEYEVIQRARDASRGRRAASDAAVGIMPKPRKPSAAERRKMAARSK